VLWFLLKVTAIIYLYILVRGTLPRMRYDRLMNFGWKVLIPFGLVWVLVTGAVVVLPERFSWERSDIVSIAGIAVGILILLWIVGAIFDRRPRGEVSR
jgi:NADH-quinone oxidoreductase subunit H